MLIYQSTKFEMSRASIRLRPILSAHHYVRAPFCQSIYIKCFQGVGIVSVFFICVSILTFCLKTHPDMRVPLIHNLTVKEGIRRE